MKRINYYLALLLAVMVSSPALMAQEDGSMKGEKGTMKVIVMKDDNGKVEEYKKEFSAEDHEELEKYLKEKGIDLELHQLKEEAGGEGVKYEYKFTEDEDDNGDVQKKVMIMKMESRDDLDESDVNVFMDQDIDLQWNVDSSDGEHKIIKINCKVGDKEMNQVFVFDHDTMLMDVDSNNFNSFVFISRDKGENNEKTFGTKLSEEKLSNMPIEDLSMYPNPTDGNFRAEFNVVEESDVVLSITDSKGAMIFEKELNSFKGRFKEDVDLSKEEAGLYFFNIKIGNDIQSRKILLQ